MSDKNVQYKQPILFISQPDLEKIKPAMQESFRSVTKRQDTEETKEPKELAEEKPVMELKSGSSEKSTALVAQHSVKISFCALAISFRISVTQPAPFSHPQLIALTPLEIIK